MSRDGPAQRGCLRRQWKRWNAWITLSSALLSGLAGAHLYVFGVYSNELKTLLFHGDSGAQTKVQSLKLAGDLCTFLPLGGMFYDSKFGGPLRTLLMGGFWTFVGFFMMSRAAAGWEPGYAPLIMFGALSGHSVCYVAAAVLPPAIKGFPHHKGLAVGMVKSFFGLGASVLTQFYYAFFEDEGSADAAGFLLFVSIFCPCVAAVCGLFLCEPKPVEKDDPLAPPRFKYAISVLACLTTMFLVSSLWKVMGTVHDLGDTVVLSIGCTLCILLLVIPRGTAPYHHRDGVAAAAPDAGKLVVDAQEDGSQDDDAPPPPPEGLTPTEAVSSANFWLLYCACFAGMGGYLVVGNNVAQIFEAKAGRDASSGTDSDVAVQLMSVMSTLGRLGWGMSSDVAVRRGLTRPLCICMCLLCQLGGHLLCLLPSVGALFPGVCLVSFSYGGFWALMPTTVAEVFGPRFFASNQGWMGTAAALGSLALSTLLAGQVYEHHQEPVVGDDGEADHKCYGDVCYAVTHVVVVLLCGVGMLCLAGMHCRTRALYRRWHVSSGGGGDDSEQLPLTAPAAAPLALPSPPVAQPSDAKVTG